MPSFLRYAVPIVLIASLGACSSDSGSARAEDPFSLPGGRELLGNPEIPAICYSGHRKVPRSVENTPTVEETKEDLRILSAMGIRLIRTYNTTDFPHSERTLQAIRELKAEEPDFEMFVMLGAWIQCEGAYTDSVDHTVEDAEFNRREIEAAIRLAGEYPDIVRIVAVGNESMVTWQAHYVPASAVLRWVTFLRDARDRGDLPAGTRITTSENWAALGGVESYRNEDLAELHRSLDFVSLHTYAFLDTYYNPAFRWASGPDETGLPVLEQIERAVARSIEWQESEVQAVQAYLDSLGVDTEIHIGETGWASRDDSFFAEDGTRAADEYIAGLFHAAVRKWTRDAGRTCFTFEAFDEPWKSGGTDNCEGHFGLFTVDGQAKYALWDQVDAGVFAGLTRGGNPIVKTHGGDEQVLLEDLAPPAHHKFHP